ncbi:MAG: HIRAN domain-containing protein [Chromatiales bacterium]|jgi:hypothetical protein
MKALYIAWQDPENRLWHTVGRLSHNADGYSFTYTQGANTSPRFDYLGRMQNKRQIYHSVTLFPLFANRLLDSSRPEYPSYLEWMGLDETVDDLELLARSGGQRGTDKLCVYPEVEANDRGEMELYFFSHGLRYLNSSEQSTIGRLRPGDSLLLTPEKDNVKDRYALLLVTTELVRVGYCPRYLNQSLHQIQNKMPINLCVEKVNPDAPHQFRLLCKLTFTPPKDFKLYASDEHQPMTTNSMVA